MIWCQSSPTSTCTSVSIASPCELKKPIRTVSCSRSSTMFSKSATPTIANEPRTQSISPSTAPMYGSSGTMKKTTRRVTLSTKKRRTVGSTSERRSRSSHAPSANESSEPHDEARAATRQTIDVIETTSATRFSHCSKMRELSNSAHAQKPPRPSASSLRKTSPTPIIRMSVSSLSMTDSLKADSVLTGGTTP